MWTGSKKGAHTIMSNFKYSVGAADECMRLMDELIYEYNAICSETGNSVISAVNSWEGDTASLIHEKSDAFARRMNLTKMEMNAMRDKISASSGTVKSLENTVNTVFGSGVK